MTRMPVPGRQPHVTNLLHWSWCVLGLLSIIGIGILHGAPIPAPDLQACQEDPLIPKCCPPVPRNKSIKDFRNPTSSALPLRVRQPAHQLDSATVRKLKRAYSRMRALPVSDPRSLEQQRKMHCAYCCALFSQPWTVEDSGEQIEAALQIHFGWLLMPWHRLFLYFHERILASLIGDNTLALPFWNWSNQLSVMDAKGRAVSPGAMPAPYQVPGSALYDSKRSAAHQPPAIANLSYNSENRPSGVQINAPQLKQANLNMMHQVMVNAATTRAIFFGQPYRFGGQILPGGGPGQGVLESTVHNSIHDWTGNENNRDFDMGALFVSAIDPIFYAHHGEIDRLWNIYKARGGHDLDDPDFLDTEFLFYDETAQLVRVKVRQGLDTVNQLRYTYQSVATADSEWLSYAAIRCASHPGDSASEWLQQVRKYEDGQLEISVAKPFTARLARPDRGWTTASGDDGDQPASAEVVLLDGLKVDWTRSAHLKVFVNLADASTATSTMCAEFLGVFSHLGNKVPAGHDKVAYRLGLGNKLRQLGLEAVLEVVISLVPGDQHTSSSPVSIDRVRITLEQV